MYLLIGVLGLVPDLHLADVGFAVLEVVDLHDFEVTRKAPDVDGSKGSFSALGDGDGGGHKSIIVLV